MRLFLDANILFSAACPGSRIGELLERAARRHTLVSSSYAVEEARRNIRLKRPDWVGGLQSVLARVEIVPGLDGPVPVEIAAKDRPILATALKTKCAVLVTGDRRDFGHLLGRSVGSLRVLTPLGLAGLLVDSGELG